MKEKQVRIMILLRYFPNLGGVETISVELANEFAARGKEVWIAGEEGNVPLGSFSFQPGVTIHTLKNGFESEKIVECINDNHIDVVINQGCFVQVTPILRAIKRNTSAKIISVLHSTPEAAVTTRKEDILGNFVSRSLKKIGWPIFSRWSNRRYVNNIKEVAGLSDYMITLSESYITSLQKIIGEEGNNSKYVSIPNFIKSTDCKEKYEKNKVVVYIGRVVEKQKKVSRLIAIWKELSVLHPDWKFKIVGDGADMPLYKDIVENHKIKNIEFLGYCRDVAPYLKESSLMVLTSDYEGLPMSIIESMAYGCVPVCYDSFTAVHDMIESGKDGFIIPYNNKEEFIRVMNKIMIGEIGLSSLSEAAIKKGMQYRAEKVMDKWERIIKR